MSNSSSSTSSLHSSYYETNYSTSSSYSDVSMSTPSKRGAVGVTTPTLTNVMPQLKEDTNERLFDGATIEDFVQYTWGTPADDIHRIMSEKWSLDSALLEDYRSATSEPQMYKPFSSLAENLISQVRTLMGKGSDPMTFWNSKGTHVIKNLFTLRKPDMLAMRKDSSIAWLMAFLIIEFKRTSNVGSGSNASSQTSSRNTSLSGVPGTSAMNLAMTGSRKPGNKSHSMFKKSSQPRTSSRAEGSRMSLARGVGTEVRRSSRLAAKTFPAGGSEEGASASPSVASGKKRRHSYDINNVSSKRARNSESNSPRITNDQMQLATYALEAMAVSTRRYTTGIFIDKFILSLWYYDRACVIKTISIDFRVDVAKFALILYAISTCSTGGAGFDPFMCHYPPTHHPDEDKPLDNIIGAHMVFPRVESQEKGPAEMRFRIKDILYAYRGLVGRGTMVYHVSEIHPDGQAEDGRVLKMSYPVVTRPREADTVAKLLNAIPEWKHHLPEINFSATYTAEDMGLPRVKLLKRLPANSIELEDRSLHVLSTSLYKKLWEVDNVVEFQNVFVDCVECHYHAYARGKILHRDLSENNLMFKSHEGRSKGIVNDWDMGSHLDNAGEVPLSAARHRTGTIPFMARDLLVDNPPPHLYRHDLESFYYILVWAVVHFDLPNKRRYHNHHALADWDASTLDQVRKSKMIFIQNRTIAAEIFAHARKEFAQLRTEWLEPLRRLFKDAAESEERNDSPDYDFKTYGGILTFETFMAGIGRKPRSLSTGPLE